MDDECILYVLIPYCVLGQCSPLDQWLFSATEKYSRTNTIEGDGSRTENNCLPVAPVTLLGGINAEPTSGNLGNC